MDQEDKNLDTGNISSNSTEAYGDGVKAGETDTTNTRVLDRKKVYVDLGAYDANRHDRKGYVIDITSRGVGLKKVHVNSGDVIHWVICANEHFPVERFSFIAKCRWTSVDQFNNDPLSGFQITRISPEDSARLRKFLLFLGSRYFRDLTSHLRVEDALRSVEAQYRSIVDSQNELIVRFLPNSEISFANQAFCNLVRKHKDVLVGKNFFDWALVEPDHDPKASLSLLTIENPSSVTQFALVGPTGDVKYYEWSQKCFFDGKGIPNFYQLVGREITERILLPDKRQKKIGEFADPKPQLSVQSASPALLSTKKLQHGETAGKHQNHKSLDEFSSLVLEDSPKRQEEIQQALNLKIVADRANFGLAMADMDENVIYSNNYFATIHGFSAEDVIGKKISVFHTPDQMRSVDKLNNELKTDGCVAVQEVWHVHRSGREFPMLMSGVLIRDEQDNPALMAISAIDVTELKQVQEALAHSQKMEALGTLAGGIAHDVNNALFVMTGYADLALEEVEPDSRLANYLKSVLKSGQKIKKMISQILTFSRGSTDDKNSVHVTPLLKEITKYMIGAMPRNIRLEEHINCPNDRILADTTQLYQLITNLIVNARDAMIDKGGTLRIALENVDTRDALRQEPKQMITGNYVLITISDEGQGMTKEIKDRMFDPFFTTKQAGQGIGMGLPMIHMILENHQANIEVDSELGKGTIIRVYFRVLESESAEKNEVDKHTQSLGSGNILIVDDEPNVLDMLRQLLELMGYSVTPVSSAKQALNLAQQHPEKFNLLITDLTMPEMNGIQLIRDLRKSLPSLPVILCSGYTDVIEKEKDSEIGITAFLTKPISLNDLSTTLKKALEPKANN